MVELKDKTMIGKKAEDIMIPIERYPNIFEDLTLRQAMAEFEHAYLNIDGEMSLPRALLVIDKDFNLIGIVRRRDILQGLEPDFMKHIPHHHQKELIDIEGDPNLVILSSGKVIKTMHAHADHMCIADIMQPVTDKIQYNDHIAKIIYMMTRKDLNLLPVMKKRRIIGVVRSVDVFHEVAHLLLD
ncbi:MAG: CBS domain-containing protein [candidate division Zixibacteria bacterium]|nr:CBS domain-containing protein [candidate division Zixibacteria bacterium]